MEKQLSLQENLKIFEQKQIVISLLGLVILMGLSIIANRLFMRAAAEQTSRLITRMIQIDDFREVNLTLQDAKLDYFSKIQYESKSLNRSFTFPPLAEYVNESSLSDKLMSEKIEINPQSIGSSSSEDKITFEYNRFGFIGYAIGIWLVLILVSVPQTRLIKNRIIKQFEKDLELQKKSAHAEVSRKVRHNINTPLAALIAMTERLERLNKDDQVLFQGIVTQIKSLVKDLDVTEKPTATLAPRAKTETQSIYQALEQSLSENQLAFENKFEITYDVDSTLLSANVSFIPYELRSIISNLIQNAADASTPRGEIKIFTQDLSNEVKLIIEDFGKGIPADMLEKVTEKNFTYDKTHGTGLGLYHANQFINSWGGNLKIESTIGVGTKVIITLPIESRAKWFTPRIKARNDQSVVFLDDQEVQHLQWHYMLDTSKFKGDRHFFSSANEFLEFKHHHITEDNISKYVFLFDNQISDDKTDTHGIELLMALPASSNKYLITSDASDLSLQEACISHKIHLVPKDDLVKTPFISISIP